MGITEVEKSKQNNLNIIIFMLFNNLLTADLDELWTVPPTPFTSHILCASYLFIGADDFVLIVWVIECEYYLSR